MRPTSGPWYKQYASVLTAAGVVNVCTGAGILLWLNYFALISGIRAETKKERAIGMQLSIKASSKCTLSAWNSLVAHTTKSMYETWLQYI